MEKLISLKEFLIPFLATLGITFLTNSDDESFISIQVNSIGFYILIIACTWFSIWSINKLRDRIRCSYIKFQTNNYEEIRKKCNEKRSTLINT